MVYCCGFVNRYCNFQKGLFEIFVKDHLEFLRKLKGVLGINNNKNLGGLRISGWMTRFFTGLQDFFLDSLVIWM